MMKWGRFRWGERCRDLVAGDRHGGRVEDCRRGDVYVGVTTIFSVVLVIQNVAQASSSRHVFCGWDPSLLRSLDDSTVVVGVVGVIVVVVGGVDNVGNENVVVVVDDVDEVVGIGTGEGDEAGVDEGASVAVVGGVRVLAFEVGALFVSGVVVHVQVRKCFPKLHQEVAGVGMVICLAASPAFPLER